MPYYSLEEVQQIIGAQWLQRGDTEEGVQQLLLDSRSIASHKGALFFALVGRRHDGHRFVSAAYAAGVRQFVVRQDVPLPDLPGASVLGVSDTLQALQTLAAHHRRRFSLPVIGITGSNGKTIVKEWLHHLIGRRYCVVRSPKSYNSQVGVPLSVWAIEAEHTLGIFEAGISQMGEMARLSRIIQPQIGIFTNIGPAHREGFPSEEVKLQEKMRLFDAAEQLVFCADHHPIAAAAEAWVGRQPGRKLFAWTLKGRASASVRFYRVGSKRSNGLETVLRVERDGPEGGAERCRLVLPFADEAFIENACHCIAVLLLLGVPVRAFRSRLKQLEPIDMRLSWKPGVNRCAVLDDSYSNDPASLRIALQAARQQWRDGRITLILSDFLQAGANKRRLYTAVAQLLRDYRIDRLIAVGSAVRLLEEELSAVMSVAAYPDTDALLHDLPRLDFHDELIIVKGARAFAFERVVRRLEQKAHRTVLEVSLDAVAHNLGVFSRYLTPGTKIMVMLKAAGYGSGAVELGRALAFYGVDYLGVAYAAEGVELRQGKIRLPILVLNPEPSAFDTILRHQLEPEVYSAGLLEGLIGAVGRRHSMLVHLKLDTGMHRLGLTAGDLPAVLERLKQYPNLRVQSVFSHLVASDAPQHDAFTHAQAAEFIRLYEQIAEALGYRPLRHLLNSAGIARFPQYHFDMVRLGIGLYGVASGSTADRLRPVHTLKARVSQVKSLPAGATVGYQRKGRLLQPSRIATISIGYADGLLRLAGNGRFSVLIRGRRAPTVGNICMDMAMVDVTDIPGVQEGDEVTIFGGQPTLQELAECLQTIPYEVLTNISERVKRIYWQE